MLSQSRDVIEKHKRTHTERSAEDVAAISTIEFFFRSDGKINTNFAKNDKWPNTDGTFEFVPNPDVDRRPKHSFIVQVKGTHSYTETSGEVKYALKSLAFPAFIATDVTLDPGLLIVVLNPDIRGRERIFYKYMSVEFINSIDFNKESATITFTADEEILNTDESINLFCKKLESVIVQHSFVNKLSEKELDRNEIDKIIVACDKHITSKIDLSEFNNIDHIVDITNEDSIDTYIPYITLKNEIKKTGEIYFEKGIIATDKDIIDYNNSLDDWEKSQGYQIKTVDDFVTIDSYERTTISILKSLISFTEEGNKGQKEYNASYLKESKLDLSEDKQKEIALKNVFVNSRLMLIYGAAGTGKTTLINYISNMMPNHKKLFLTKTHTAKQNLKRRIENPGVGAEFISLDSFTKKVSLPDYDIIFVDECSTIDNRIMRVFLDKVRRDALLVFAGDIYQIESIEFGNWFLYAKDIINTPGANVELLNTWRTKEPDLIGLWDEVRHCGGLMTEKLSMDGPFSEDIGENVFAGQENDEVVLCLNYDGKFGLNNMNSYFQSANTKGKAVVWQDWIYKVGDPILFNDTKRFTILYNNLKGRIVDVEKVDNCIWFTIDVAINITEDICKREGIEWISAGDGYTRIKFEVQSFSDEDYEKDASLRMMSIVPFQLAYAVSIHKAQGLEYDSVKVVIPRSNSERITHGIFYTAITRAKKKLKIYWSSETMEEIVSGFEEKVSRQKSFEIVKKRVID